MQCFNLYYIFTSFADASDGYGQNLDLSPVIDDMFFWKNCLMMGTTTFGIFLLFRNSRRRYSSCGLYDTTIILFRWIHHPASHQIISLKRWDNMHPLLKKKVINLMAYLPAYDCNHLQDSVGAVFLGRAWKSLHYVILLKKNLPLIGTGVGYNDFFSLHYVDGTLAAQLVNLMGNCVTIGTQSQIQNFRRKKDART
ncbi:hypothetical protein ACJX0J_015989 [Zea mays]